MTKTNAGLDLSASTDDLRDFLRKNDLSTYLSTKERESARIEQSRSGTIPQGLKLGWEDVDRHFRLKLGNLVIMNGHDNVGKSFIVWYLQTISALKYNWKWIMFCAENRSADIRVQIAEFVGGKLAKFMTDDEFAMNIEFSYTFFEIIEFEDSVEDVESCDKIIEIAERIIAEKGQFQGLLIDPYNSLDIDISALDRRLSTHDYHYICAKNLRKFAKKHNIAVWVNMHAVSEALRKVDKDGYSMPPQKADTEGGGKFANRADDFITWHRYVQDASRSMTTEGHVRKIKDTKTGGKCTDLKNPINLTWRAVNGFYGFYTGDDFCPLSNKKTPEHFTPERFPETDNVYDKPF